MCMCVYVCGGNVGVCVCIPPLNNCVHTEPMGSGCSRLKIFCTLFVLCLYSLPLPSLEPLASSSSISFPAAHLLTTLHADRHNVHNVHNTRTRHAHAHKHKHACYTTESQRHIPHTFHTHSTDTQVYTQTHTRRHTHADTRTDTTHAHHITSHHITSHHITNANHHAGNTTTQQRVHQPQVPAPDIQGD